MKDTILVAEKAMAVPLVFSRRTSVASWFLLACGASFEMRMRTEEEFKNDRGTTPRAIGPAQGGLKIWALPPQLFEKVQKKPLQWEELTCQNWSNSETRFDLNTKQP